ncbi:MAG: VCBS repeat-containing protein, partial [Planctomycetes bacterium]|nr:VCBS repeat-containing protein [Planctomycetota bacterium]
MKAATAITPLLITLLACSPALGDGAKIMHVTDAAAAVPGRTIITDYDGPLPPDNPRDEILQMPGWPVVIGSAGSFTPWRGVVFADLDGNDDLEIITSSTDNRIYAWDHTGTAMPGFPVATIGMAQYPPSVADLDGDGDLEIVQFTRGVTSGGRLYILDHLGNLLPGFPISVNNNNLAGAPSLHDLDNDGVLEIIVPERAWPIGFLHVFEIDGTEWGGNWPVALDHVPTGTAAVADVDNDDALEIVYTSYTTMYLFELDGSVMPGWPRQLNDARFSYQSAVLADLDGDHD